MAILPLRARNAAPTGTTPARTALAAAIARHQGGIERLARLEGASEGAWQQIDTAALALSAATEAARDAEGAAARHAVARLLGDETGPEPSPAEAKRALEHAQAALAIAKQAKVSIRREQESLTAEMPHLARYVDDAAVAVLQDEGAPAIAALVARLEAAHREVCDAGAALHSLWATHVVPMQPGVNPAARAAWLRYQQLPISWDIANRRDASPTAARWNAALAALKNDASAAVPK